MTKDEEVAAIKAALTTLIDACMDHRRAGSPGSRRSLEAVSFADIVLSETRAQDIAEGIISDPLGESYRRSVRSLGKRLFELGGLNAMQDAADEVANARGEGQFSARVDIMDKRWDGIGTDEGGVGWAA